MRIVFVAACVAIAASAVVVEQSPMQFPEVQKPRLAIERWAKFKAAFPKKESKQEGKVADTKSALEGAFNDIEALRWTDAREIEQFLYDIASDKYANASTELRDYAINSIDDLEEILTLLGLSYRSKNGVGWDGSQKLTKAQHLWVTVDPRLHKGAMAMKAAYANRGGAGAKIAKN